MFGRCAQVLTDANSKGYAMVVNVPLGPTDDQKKWELLFKEGVSGAKHTKL